MLIALGVLPPLLNGTVYFDFNLWFLVIKIALLLAGSVRMVVEVSLLDEGARVDLLLFGLLLLRTLALAAYVVVNHILNDVDSGQVLKRTLAAIELLLRRQVELLGLVDDLLVDFLHGEG
jgi:hypothetical protein